MTQRAACVLLSHCLCVCDSVKEVVCFGEGAGANILARFAVSLLFLNVCMLSVLTVERVRTLLWIWSYFSLICFIITK